MLDDRVAEITRREVSLSHAHTRLSVVNAHASFRLDDFREDGSEGLLERV